MPTPQDGRGGSSRPVAFGGKDGAGFLACAWASVLLVVAIDARTVIPVVGRYLALTIFRGLFED